MSTQEESTSRAVTTQLLSESDLVSSLQLNNGRGRCPIHGGDNDTAFHYNEATGRWRCYTHGCHNLVDRNDLKGLAKHLGWRLNTVQSIKVVKKKSEIVLDRVAVEDAGVTDTYFTSRGFLPQTSAFFEAFKCNNPSHPLFGRSVIPLKNDEGMVVGYSGRTSVGSMVKWLHYPKNLVKSEILYNLHHAKSFIQAHHTIILTEGILKVWRLWEAKICCSVATLGTSFSDKQFGLLNKYGVNKIILLMDEDEAGMKFTNSIYNRCPDNIEIFSLRHLITSDIDEMTVEQINQQIKPTIKSIIYGN